MKSELKLAKAQSIEMRPMNSGHTLKEMKVVTDEHGDGRSRAELCVDILAVFAIVLMTGIATPAAARSTDTVAKAGMALFADNCFSPFMTAAKTARRFNVAGVRYDFYDLDPFSSVEPSPVVGRAATAGTDRRCEISFDGEYTQQSIDATKSALKREGIATKAKVPASHTPRDGTALLAARQLNPHRVAVVHIGTRPGPNGGAETFLNVERLLPLGGK